MNASSAYAMTPEVQRIQRTAPTRNRASIKKKVAAYCRVSTELEQQKSSLDTQMESYRTLIAAHADWELADIYVDEGKTGTSTEKRTGFLRMIADAEAGKIDYILAKSISRFARNTVDTLLYTRKLKSIGVYVYFEKDRVDTANASSELIMTVMAAVAQEESHSISENMKWGIRKRFQAGIPKWTATYGYSKTKDGAWVIVPEEAAMVRRIFDMYLSGQSLPEIAKSLEFEGIPAPNGRNWWPHSLTTILRNEKYIGDVIMQKSYTVDHLTHKRERNDATVVPKYYVKDHHEAIIDRSVFERVHYILTLKDRHRGCIQYPYYGFLICPICGEKMVRFTLPSRGLEPAWTCGGKCQEEIGVLERRQRTACPPYVIKEKYIQRLLLDAFDELDSDALRQIAAKDGRKGEAARAALRWKQSRKEMKQIEFLFLDELVRKITFKRWTEALVSWNFGETTRVRVEYEKISETPGIRVEYKDGEYFANGERIHANGSQIMPCVKRMHEHCDRLRIIDPNPADHAAIPCVLCIDSEKIGDDEECAS